MKELVLRFDDDDVYEDVVECLEDAAKHMGKPPAEAGAIILEDALFQDEEEAGDGQPPVVPPEAAEGPEVKH